METHVCSLRDDDAAWQKSDRSWFERKPTRSHRVRKPYSGELKRWGGDDSDISGTWMLVRQYKPELRIRMPITCEHRPPDKELLLHALFDEIRITMNAGKQFTNIENVNRRVLMMTGTASINVH